MRNCLKSVFGKVESKLEHRFKETFSLQESAGHLEASTCGLKTEHPTFQLASPAELDEAGTGLPLALPHLGQHRTHPKHDCLQPLQTYLQCPRSALVAVVTSEAFGWLPQPP
jgi:hypothetical protein